jgi:hypothetical protein
VEVPRDGTDGRCVMERKLELAPEPAYWLYTTGPGTYPWWRVAGNSKTRKATDYIELGARVREYLDIENVQQER